MISSTVSRRGPAARARVVVTACAAGFAAVGSVACSPCDGVAGCRVEPRLGLSGDFSTRDNLTARPIPGVRVDVVSRSPDLLVDSVATAESDAGGWWSVAMRARATGTATVDVVVTPPAPDRPYRVSGLQYAVTSLRGQGAETGRWVARPFVSYIGLLRDKGTGLPLIGARVTIIRRGGVGVTPTTATDTAPATDSSGTFLYDVKPDTIGAVYVDLFVDRPGSPRATIRNAVVPVGYEWGPPHPTAGSTFYVGADGSVTGGQTAATRRPATAAAPH